MEYITRNYDLIEFENDLEELFCFSEFPVYMGVTDKSRDSDLLADMQWMISKGSGMIQLSKLIPDHILYEKSHNSGLGKVWQEHYKLFSKFLVKYASNSRNILEIGGATES